MVADNFYRQYIYANEDGNNSMYERMENWDSVRPQLIEALKEGITKELKRFSGIDYVIYNDWDMEGVLKEAVYKSKLTATTSLKQVYIPKSKSVVDLEKREIHFRINAVSRGIDESSTVSY